MQFVCMHSLSNAGRVTGPWYQRTVEYEDVVEFGHVNRFDYNFQPAVYLDETLQMKKNDRIVGECVYNTMKEDSMVYGGIGTRDEMCLFYIFHYPIDTEKSHNSRCIDWTTLNQRALPKNPLFD